MLQFLKAALSAIPSAAVNGYAFGAYALAIAAYVLTVWRVARNKNLLANIQKLPPKDRLSVLEIEIGGVRLAKGISPEQWVRSRIHRYYLFAFLATCVVAVAIAAMAALKGVNYVQTLTIINNEYRQFSNGAPLSGPDLQHIEDLLNGLMSRDRERAQTAFNQLSKPARDAYQRAYPSAREILVPAQELSEGPPVTSRQTAASAREVEPNNDILNPNEIPLNATIDAAIDSPSDVDFFTFSSPGPRRDYIDIVVSNGSTTLAPEITVYKSDKGTLNSTYNATPGGDASYSFAAQPSSRFYVRVSSRYGSSSGSYRLAVRARNAFDGYEPNDDILNASLVEVGKTIEANIMDPSDVDFYRFDTGNNARLAVSLENRSTTLAPEITIYKPDKGVASSTYNATPGGDVIYSFAAQPNSRFYVRVSSRYGANSGKYALTIRPE